MDWIVERLFADDPVSPVGWASSTPDGRKSIRYVNSGASIDESRLFIINTEGAVIDDKTANAVRLFELIIRVLIVIRYARQRWT